MRSETKKPIWIDTLQQAKSIILYQTITQGRRNQINYKVNGRTMKQPQLMINSLTTAQNPSQSFYQPITFNYRYEVGALRRAWWRPLNLTHIWLLFVGGFLHTRWCVCVCVCVRVCDISPYIDDVTLSAVVLVLIQNDVTVTSIELTKHWRIHRNFLWSFNTPHLQPDTQTETETKYHSILIDIKLKIFGLQ